MSTIGRLRRRLAPLVWSYAPGFAVWLKSRRMQRAPEFYEPELQLIPALVDGERTAIDIGAHVGTYTLALSRVARRVIAVEPIAEISARLSAAHLPTVTLHTCAVSDAPGELDLTIPKVASGDTVFALATLEPRAAGEDVLQRRVPVTTVDALADAPVGFLKMDVEGHELAALRGAAETLRRDQPNVLVEVEERHRPNAVADVRAFMESHGYAGFFLLNRALHPIEEFGPELQEVANLDTGPYVNNFIYLPKAGADATLAAMRDLISA